MRLNGWVAPAYAAVVVCCATPAAEARPVKFGSDFFEYVSAPLISWSDAQTAAAALTYKGLPGYLATVASAAENAFLASQFTTQQTTFEGAWLGGEVFGSGTGGTGCWETGPLTGKEFSIGQAPYRKAYANWGGVEPNNAPSAAYMTIGGSFSGVANGQWADAANGVASQNDPVQGYIVEFGPKRRPVMQVSPTQRACSVPSTKR